MNDYIKVAQLGDIPLNGSVLVEVDDERAVAGGVGPGVGEGGQQRAAVLGERGERVLLGEGVVELRAEARGFGLVRSDEARLLAGDRVGGGGQWR